MKVTVLPTGTANIASVLAAFRRLGADPNLASDVRDIVDVERLVLPGVGSFGSAAGSVGHGSTRRALAERIEAGKPTMAVCVGLQLMSRGSEESPGVSGLGVIDSTVGRFRTNLPVPQLGWNRVDVDSESRFVKAGWAYFANSYRLTEAPPGWVVATSDYGGRFVAAIERGDVLACQFHPELSGEWGAHLLERWLSGTGGGR
jgi:imidazole glycerol phosphate synthase glutamine amidotransferase subunit